MSSARFAVALAWARAGLAAGIVAGCAGWARPGSSQVLDIETNLPISGAAVTVDCTRPGMIHGTVHVKTLDPRTTDAEGRFAVTAMEALDCPGYRVVVTKPGYKWVESDSGGAPEVLAARNFMVREENFGMYRLQAMERNWAPKSNAGAFSEYWPVYRTFLMSAQMAKTPREIAFVKDHYCDRLSSLNKALDPAERAKLETFGKPPDAPGLSHDYGKVADFCGFGQPVAR